MSSRRELAAKAQKKSALELLAAARRGERPAGGAVLGLSDDDSSGSEHEVSSGGAPTSRRGLESSDCEGSGSEEENYLQASNSLSNDSSRQPAAKLSRLRKAGGSSHQRQRSAAKASSQASSAVNGGDDLASALGGLQLGAAGSSGSRRALPAQKHDRSSGGSGSHGSGIAASKPPASSAARHHRESGPTELGAAEARQKEAEADDKDCLVLGERGEFRLSAQLSKKLYPHQVDGVKWLWGLHRMGRGGLLGDDMGLGKTMQCSAFLAGLLQNRLIRRALVIAPKTLLAHWKKELEVCGVGRQSHEFFGSVSERHWALDRVLSHRGVLLTTYGMVQHNSEQLAEHESHDPDEGPLWDVMILDEGHKIKNPKMQLRQHLDAIPASMHLIISGTPIQNNLMEMHTLFDFCVPGLLGDPYTFKMQYERLITVGQDKHATQGERERGAMAAERLRQAVAPYLLRREKKQVFGAAADQQQQESAGSDGGKKAQASASTTAATSSAPKPPSMGHKNDLIVWLKLQPMQQRVYQAFLNSDSVKAVFNQTSSALAALSVLKKICDHPALLSENAQRGIIRGAARAARKALGKGRSTSRSDSEEESITATSGEEDSDDEEEGGGSWHNKPSAKAAKAEAEAAAAAEEVHDAAGFFDWASNSTAQSLLDQVHQTGFEASCKTSFIMALLLELVAKGHRTLIFSQSRVMLNILEAAVKARGWKYCRIDGSVAAAGERQARVQRFQTDPSIPLFLLTSQVGGLGLTLTAADRVIICDPAWNPSVDDQSVDRAYRIGQQRDVVVYRLISCGTVEEKIYRRQVFKGGLSRTGTEAGEQFRYFSQQDLAELFRFDPVEAAAGSETQRELERMHAHQRKEGKGLAEHLHFLKGLEGFAGVSDHDLLFSKKDREAPAGKPRFGSKPPEAPAASFGSAQRSRATGGGAAGSGRPASSLAKAAAAGWNGAGDLSDMFSRALNVSGSSSNAAGGAGSANSSWLASGAGGAPFRLTAGAFSLPGGSSEAQLQELERQARVAELRDQLQKQRWMLGNPALLASLPDRGVRIRQKVAELEQQLAQEEGASAGGGMAAAQPATASAAAGGGGSGSGGESSKHVGSGGSTSSTMAPASRQPEQLPPLSSAAGAKPAAPRAKPAGSPLGRWVGAGLSSVAAAVFGSNGKEQAPAAADGGAAAVAVDASIGAATLPRSIVSSSQAVQVKQEEVIDLSTGDDRKVQKAAAGLRLWRMVSQPSAAGGTGSSGQPLRWERVPMNFAAPEAGEARGPGSAGQPDPPPHLLPTRRHGSPGAAEQPSWVGKPSSRRSPLLPPPQQQQSMPTCASAEADLPQTAEDLDAVKSYEKKKVYAYTKELEACQQAGGRGSSKEAQLKAGLDRHYARYKAAKKKLALLQAAGLALPDK